MKSNQGESKKGKERERSRDKKYERKWRREENKERSFDRSCLKEFSFHLVNKNKRIHFLDYLNFLIFLTINLKNRGDKKAEKVSIEIYSKTIWRVTSRCDTSSYWEQTNESFLFSAGHRRPNTSQNNKWKNLLCTYLGSISSTLYERFLYKRYNCATFSSYILALAKDFGSKNTLSNKKCACKTLMKMTPRVNSINILHTNFLYESASTSFSLVTFWLRDFLAKGYWQKSSCKMLMKLIPIRPSANFISVVLHFRDLHG